MKDVGLEHTVSLRLGDWSDDGHGKTEIRTIKTNLTCKDLAKAYDEGVKKVGFDLEEETARDYEEPYMYVEHWKMLEAVGMTLNQLFSSKWCNSDDAEKALTAGEDQFSIYIDEYVAAWLFIAKQGDPTLEHKFVENNQSIIEIGGYGLFN